ncbi:MAG: trypsin-like peptidase domain-containing protein [Anaerolineales bacterium]|nr:trypsin-like peptidase domain-containing protein [Anaerolineales bacterium]MCB9171348.1 trypsin-like peptidase domain-containing protein [Ardenticatenales bacterium]
MSNRTLLGAIAAMLLMGLLCLCALAGFLVLRTSESVSVVSEELPSVVTVEVEPVGDAETAPANDNPVSSSEGVDDGLALLRAEEAALNAVYERSNNSVVLISVGGSTESVLGEEGEGSGWLWDDEGHIVTNHHVVAGAQRVFVTLIDGRQQVAEVVGTDEDSDLAVIKIDNSVLGLAPLPLGDSTALQVGQRVIAIGNPFGFDGTLTLGVVSALGRTVPGRVADDQSVYNLTNLIQTDAAINPGNSGGPLLDIEGRVIGVNSLIYSQTPLTNSGVGFAVPVNKVKAVVPALIRSGRYETPFIGLGGPIPLTPSLAAEFGVQGTERGVLMQNVVPNGPADRAGMRGGSEQVTIPGFPMPLLVGGDVVIAVDGVEVNTFDDLINYLDTRQVGDEVAVSLIRDGNPLEIVVTLAARP